MDANNLAVVRGTVRAEPVERELTGGRTVTNLDLAVDSGSVPIAVEGDTPAVGAGDDVVVIGAVRRRFFRVGGVTQSRTEVQADRVLKASRRRAVERAVDAVVEALGGRQ